MKYLHYFETRTEFNIERNNNYIEPWVSYTENVGVAYNKPDYTKVLFTIEALGSGDMTWTLNDKTVQYSKNGGSWETMTKDTIISVVEGDEVQFKGTNTDYNSNTISSTAQFNVKGNIMSLTDGDEFETADTVNAMGFRALFSKCTYLVSANDLILPATTLTDYCYNYMFNGCTSLTTAPELPATTLASNCYTGMFNDCAKLNYIKAMFTTTPGPEYTRNWVNGVSSTGTFVKNASATWTTTGNSGIPTGWTVETAIA